MGPEVELEVRAAARDRTGAAAAAQHRTKSQNQTIKANRILIVQPYSNPDPEHQWPGHTDTHIDVRVLYRQSQRERQQT